MSTIVVRVVRSAVSSVAKKEVVDWVGRHQELVARLGPDAMTVMTIRGVDVVMGRVVQKLAYDVSMDDELAPLLAVRGEGRLLQVFLPVDQLDVEDWWARHASLRAMLEERDVVGRDVVGRDVVGRDVRTNLPNQFLLVDRDAGLLRG